MKMYQAYEFKDLKPEVKERATQEMINNRIDFEIDFLAQELREGRISEADYYKVLGCSKYYAESTGWFVPSCYYEGHKKEIDKIVNDELKQSLFTPSGLVIAYSFIDK